MIGAVEAVPYPVTVSIAVPFNAPPVAPTGGVYVAVTVQFPLGTYGVAGVPSAAFAGIAAIPGVIATVLAGVGFIGGLVCVAGETAIVAMESWPVSNTV